MIEKTIEQRVEELEKTVPELQSKVSALRVRPATWPKLDANGQPYVRRFAGE